MISVALCTYNGERYIRQQLDSILNQSMPVDEIVIHDDCSTDSTYEIISDYALRYPQITVWQNNSNLGFKKNFENALIACQGDYVFFSDQDDIWLDDKVAVTVDYLKTSGKYGVFSDGKLMDKDGIEMGTSLFDIKKLSPYVHAGLLNRYVFELLCLKDNFVTGATLAITKAAKELVIPFRTSKYIYHDMWIALRLSSMDKFGFIDRPLINYRIHKGQECGFQLNNLNQTDVLLDCFSGKGNYQDLLSMRLGAVLRVFQCKLDRHSSRKLYSTYRQLFKKCLPDSRLNFQAELLFFVTEMSAYLRTRFGLIRG